MNILAYKTFDGVEYSSMYINSCKDYLGNYLLTYKLPEDLVVTPSISKQFFEPSAINRYIRSVTVEAMTTTSATTSN